MSGKSAKTLKFSTLKVVAIETQGAYYRTAFTALAIGLSQVMIGAILMTTVMYSLYARNIHAALCTAFHFFVAEGILSYCLVNGWSTNLQGKHRKTIHVVLQLCGVICAVVGTTHTMVMKPGTISSHCVTGIVAYVLIFLSFLTGLAVFTMSDVSKLVHLSFGLTAFVSTSICLIFGFFCKEFVQWASNTVVYILTSLVIFYTLSIIAGAIIKTVLLKH